MADLDFNQASNPVQVVGHDEVSAAAVFSDNHLAVKGKSKVDDSQSTSTALLADASFNTAGAFTSILEYSNVSVSAHADQDSATDGVVIEWSTDGIVVCDGDSFSLKANLPKHWTFGVAYPYMRVRYTNGPVAQTAFSLQTILHPMHRKPSSHRVDAAIVDNDDAELVKAVLTGSKGDGYVNVKVDANGNLQTVLAPGGNIVPTIGSNIAYDDMNASTGGIARDTLVTNSTWTKLYEYTGSGLVMGILITLENLVADANKYWNIRLVVDSNEVFGASGLNTWDLGSSILYGWNKSATGRSYTWGGIALDNDTFRWDAPNNLPMSFDSSVQVYVKHEGDNRKFLAGLACLSKD